MLTSDAPAPRPLGQWLVESVPRGTNLEAPDRHSNRETPFDRVIDAHGGWPLGKGG